MCPARTANINGEKPVGVAYAKALAELRDGLSVFALMSAPCSASAWIAAALLLAAAHIRAVWPRVVSRRFGSAPCANRVRTVSGSPVRAAVISSVSPPGSV